MSSFLKIFDWYLLLKVSLSKSDEMNLFNIWTSTVSLVVILLMIVVEGAILKFSFFPSMAYIDTIDNISLNQNFLSIFK